jgi:hypothetical protein
MLAVNPKKLGVMRKDDPDGIAFMEYYLVDSIKKQAKEAKKNKAKPRRRR